MCGKMKKQIYNPETKQWEWQEQGAAYSRKGIIRGDFTKKAISWHYDIHNKFEQLQSMSEYRSEKYIKGIKNKQKFIEKKYKLKTDEKFDN